MTRIAETDGNVSLAHLQISPLGAAESSTSLHASRTIVGRNVRPMARLIAGIQIGNPAWLSWSNRLSCSANGTANSCSHLVLSLVIDFNFCTDLEE